MAQSSDPRIQAVLDAIRETRELAFEFADALGLPRETGYVIMRHLRVITPEDEQAWSLSLTDDRNRILIEKGFAPNKDPRH